jgi:hypothetical protein
LRPSARLFVPESYTTVVKTATYCEHSQQGHTRFRYAVWAFMGNAQRLSPSQWPPGRVAVGFEIHHKLLPGRVLIDKGTQFSGRRQARPDKPCSFFSNSTGRLRWGRPSGVGWAFNVASRQIRLPGNSGSVKLHGQTLLRQPHPLFHRSGLQCPASSVEANR